MKAPKSNILFITFPVDLGNKTLELNIQKIFNGDVDFISLNDKIKHKVLGINITNTYCNRLLNALHLREIIKSYSKTDCTIIFQGISPALFTLGAWQKANIIISLDWTRTLYAALLHKKFEKSIIFKIHQKLLLQCPKIICLTDAVYSNLLKTYKVEKYQLFRCPMPFDIDRFKFPFRNTPKVPRVLFIGADYHRKGGDLLVEAWKKELKGIVELTIVTNWLPEHPDGLTFIKGIKYGSDIHRNLFLNHDIFILPTRYDAYPQVIGEAAAAGLAVITTKFALGAREIIENGKNGYISDTQASCIQLLLNLVNDIDKINAFKKASRNIMEEKYSGDVIRSEFFRVIDI
ncbi:glycosyltransferase family 4 protein [Cyclobacterium roseum]|uniref:glycosyltransferase family 4 protein n=1 Tax=Cyclobacterium roseum TaxID=2666137 RepID=UPI0013917E79|nr:glycosyltransferase family 4 protein [Cyclobacterium roseum]